jgi:hypothetical protein
VNGNPNCSPPPFGVDISSLPWPTALEDRQGVVWVTERLDEAAVSAGQDLDANAVYSLGSSQSETVRLQRQADELAPDSRALLDRAGLRPGQSAVDLDCGPRGVLDLLAQRVSPGAGSSVSMRTRCTLPLLPSSPPRSGGRIEAQPHRSVDSSAGIRNRSDQSVTSAASCCVVYVSPELQKVVRPDGSQPCAPRVPLMVFKSVSGSRPATLLPASSALGNGSPSKIIPCISRG